jgi:large subunit ribosomal protein L24
MKNIKKTHIKIGDKVQVITGEQKGFLGIILSFVKKKSLIILEGISPRIKYSKKSQNGETKKVEIPVTIHVSNVMLWDKQTNETSRIGYKLIEGKKKRYFKKSGIILQ